MPVQSIVSVNEALHDEWFGSERELPSNVSALTLAPVAHRLPTHVASTPLHAARARAASRFYLANELIQSLGPSKVARGIRHKEAWQKFSKKSVP
jgi:hypothetical protein